MTGIENMVALVKGALEDLKRHSEGKKLSDWGAGMLATMEKFHDHAVKFAAEEKDERAKNKGGLISDLEEILDMGDDVAKHMDITIKGEPTVLISYIKKILIKHGYRKE